MNNVTDGELSRVHQFPGTRSAAGAERLKLLVIETTHTLEIIRERAMEPSITCRDLNGFFSHVWSVHPVATLVTSDGWTPRYGRPHWHKINSRHSFIEGKVGRFPWLRRFFALNFLVAQIDLFISLAALIRRKRISAIRAGDPLYTGLFAWLLSRWCGIPFLVRVGANHDLYYEMVGKPIMPRLFRRRSIEKKAEQFIFRRADRVACASRNYLRFAVASGARPDRSTIFPFGNLLDKRHFTDPTSRPVDQALLDELGLRRGGFIMCIGRLELGKRPDEVVQALAELRRCGHDLKAVLVGDGTMRQSLVALTHELEVEHHVVLAGNRAQGWLASMIPCAAAVVSPATGRALTEAALGGAPIVAYDVDWQGELIRSGETGELVPYRDWKAMATSVARYLRDPNYASAMGRAVRQEAIERFDPEKLDEHERQQYAQMIRGFAQGRS